MTAGNFPGWGSVSWQDPDLAIQIGTLELNMTKTNKDVLTMFQYAADVYWKSPEGWLSEWRTILAQEISSVQLTPTCPQRNVVAKPIKSLFLPAQCDVTIFVGYPAWLQVITENNFSLADVATELMSDTWLGPNTRSGEIAYATPTHARLDREKLPDTQHIIRTPVHIQNDSSKDLHINRVSIPAPELSTYSSGERLWGSPVTIHCDETLSEASIKVHAHAPEFLDAPTAASAPRVVESGSSMHRAIGFLLG